MTGVDITAMARGSDDYISGYFIVPRILGTVFSGMAEITVLILAAVLFIVLLIFLDSTDHILHIDQKKKTES